MPLTLFVRLFTKLLPMVLSSPFYAAYGALVIARAVVRAIVTAVRGLTVFQRSLYCPQGHEVPVVGRYACSSCKAEYLGHLSVCGCCKSGADFTICPTCRLAVRLPWEST